MLVSAAATNGKLERGPPPSPRLAAGHGQGQGRRHTCAAGRILSCEHLRGQQCASERGHGQHMPQTRRPPGRLGPSQRPARTADRGGSLAAEGAASGANLLLGASVAGALPVPQAAAAHLGTTAITPWRLIVSQQCLGASESKRLPREEGPPLGLMQPG
jgi:hypothetical protein